MVLGWAVHSVRIRLVTKARSVAVLEERTFRR
uniref:Uncharacterized protein n=1 Tax=Anopheles dirus TaxID=7168 RepID=A0A182NWU4_9DIPT